MIMIIREWKGEKLFIYNIDYNFVDVLIGVILVMILTRVKMYMMGGGEILEERNVFILDVDVKDAKDLVNIFCLMQDLQTDPVRAHSNSVSRRKKE